MHEFIAPILRQDTGNRLFYVPIPDEMARALEEENAKRIDVSINGQTRSRGFMGGKGKERYFVLGKSVMRDLRVTPGELIEVQLSAEDPDKPIDIGETLTTVLEEDPEAFERFQTFTRALKRGLALHVSQAKSPESKIKRALDVAYKIRTHTLYGDLLKKQH